MTRRNDSANVFSHWNQQNQTPPVGPRPQPVPPRSTSYPPPPPFQDPTDIGAQLYQAQQPNAENPIQMYRVLEYYGDPNIRNILTVIGYQVHRATAQGVLITENGPTTRRTFIPWHRVHDLKFAPGDMIMDNLNHNY